MNVNTITIGNIIVTLMRAAVAAVIVLIFIVMAILHIFTKTR
jgi:hypothetical protein